MPNAMEMLSIAVSKLTTTSTPVKDHSRGKPRVTTEKVRTKITHYYTNYYCPEIDAFEDLLGALLKAEIKHIQADTIYETLCSIQAWLEHRRDSFIGEFTAKPSGNLVEASKKYDLLRSEIRHIHRLRKELMRMCNRCSIFHGRKIVPRHPLAGDVLTNWFDNRMILRSM